MERSESGCTLLHTAVLACVCGLVFFVFLGKSPFHDKAEPREALVVRDMVVEGRWLFPLRSGEQIPSKPPLFHWFAAVASLVRGEMTEASIRFPSALFASLGVFLLYGFGRRLCGARCGLWAGLIVSTMAVYWAVGGEARVDMTLTFFLTLSLVLFYSLYRGFLHHEGWWYLFFFIVGASVTAKGPVSVVLCALVIVIFLVLRKRWDFLRRVLFHPGLFVGGAACLAWYSVALYVGGSEFFGIQFVKENFARFFVYGEGGTGHQKPFHYFFPYLFTLGMPWTLFLPALIWSAIRSDFLRRDEMLYLAVWTAVVFALFSFSAGKRPPYILPLYPPLALMTAVWLGREGHAESWRSFYHKGVAVFASITGALIAVALAVHLSGLNLVRWAEFLRIGLNESEALELSVMSAALSGKWIVAGFLASSALLWFSVAWNFYRLNVVRAVLPLAAATVLQVMFARGIIVPIIADLGSYKEFVDAALDQTVAGESLALYPRGIDYSSIVFYGGDKVKIIVDDPALLRDGLVESADYIIVREDLWNSLAAGLAAKAPVVWRSRGLGPDGDARLVLVRGGTQ